jgi:hypothetical protein
MQFANYWKSRIIHVDKYSTVENLRPIAAATTLKVCAVALWRSNSGKRDQS